MQIIKTTSAAIFSPAFTLPMLTELGTKYLGMSADAVDKLASQKLAKASKGNGRSGLGSSNGSGDLEFAKLRTVLVQKLQDAPDADDSPIGGTLFKNNELELEYACLADLDISKAGANKTRGARASVGSLTGPYKVVKNGLKCDPAKDPEKAALWAFVWSCTSFEEFFKAAPAKAITKTGRIITAASEIKWAVKSGWIKPEQAAKQ